MRLCFPAVRFLSGTQNHFGISGSKVRYVALNHYKVTYANVFSITHIPRNVESFHVSRRLRNFEMK